MKIDYDVGDVVVRVAGDPSRMAIGTIRRVLKIHGEDCDGSIGVSFFNADSLEWPWKGENFKKLPKADAGFTSLIKRKAAPKQVPENA